MPLHTTGDWFQADVVSLMALGSCPYRGALVTIQARAWTLVWLTSATLSSAVQIVGSLSFVQILHGSTSGQIGIPGPLNEGFAAEENLDAVCSQIVKVESRIA